MNGHQLSDGLMALERNHVDVWLPDLVAWLIDELSETGDPLWKRAYNAGVIPFTQTDEVHNPLDEIGVVWRDLARAHTDGYVCKELLITMSSALRDARSVDCIAIVLLRGLLALDQACDGLSLTDTRVTPSIRPFIQYWEDRGSGDLTRKVSKFVLRKAKRFTKGAGLAQCLKNFERVTPQQCGDYDLHIRAVPACSSLSSLSREPTLRVAFVPMLDEASDVSFRPLLHGQQKRFETKCNEQKLMSLAKHMSALIVKMQGANVHVALFPEACADGAVSDALRRALIENYKTHGNNISLRLAVLGVSRGLGDNAALVFSGNGQTLTEQRKIMPWILTKDQQFRYGVHTALADGTAPCDRLENLTLAARPSLAILEDPGFGRWIVLICEDLARADPARGIAVAVGPTHVVSPVMDGSLTERRWAYKAAEQLREQPGSVVFVVNSIVLHRLAEAAMGKGSGGRPQPGIGCIQHPDYTIAKKVLSIQELESDNEEFKVVDIPLA